MSYNEEHTGFMPLYDAVQPNVRIPPILVPPIQSNT